MTVLLDDEGVAPKEAFVDLGYRGVDADNPGVRIVHRGRIRSIIDTDRLRLKRRQAVEPVTGRLKADHRMVRCWLTGVMGEALNAVLAAAGFNLRWFMRTILGRRIRAFLRASERPRQTESRAASALITAALASVGIFGALPGRQGSTGSASIPA